MLDSQGYAEILTYHDIFRLPFKDAKRIKKADAGYAALSGAMGLFWDGKKHLGGKFEGSKKLTRGEAASLFAVLYRN